MQGSLEIVRKSNALPAIKQKGSRMTPLQIHGLVEVFSFTYEISSLLFEDHLFDCFADLGVLGYH